MPKNYGVLLPSVFVGIDELLSGSRPINIQSFANLCAVIEATVLNEKLIDVGLDEPNALSEFLVRNEVLVSSIAGKPYFADSPWIVASPLADPGAKPHFEFADENDAQIFEGLWALRQSGWMITYGHGFGVDAIRLSGGTGVEDATRTAELKICLRCAAEYVESGLLPGETLLYPKIGEHIIKTVCRPSGLKGSEAIRAANDITLAPALRLNGEAAFLHRPVYTNLLELPFLLKEEMRGGPADELYARVSKAFRYDLEQLRKFGFRAFFVPPLPAILFSRCKTRDDIPAELIRLRAEFAALRDLNTSYEQMFGTARDLREMFQIVEDFETSWDSLVRQMSRRRATVLMKKGLDVIGAGGVVSILVKGVRHLADEIRDKQLVSKSKVVHDLWSSVRAIGGPEYASLMKKIFGGTIDAEQISLYSILADRLERRLQPAR